MLITHDLGVVAGLCDEVMVMYAGRVAEYASVDRLFSEPQHPYTWGLLGSLPSRPALWSRRLMSIPGSPPNLLAPPVGCRFHPRCAFAMDACRVEPAPPLTQTSGTSELHIDACRLPNAVKDRESRKVTDSGVRRTSA
jgi:oligopeptide/dipeptide ABC transporter ATP-binding protein